MLKTDFEEFQSMLDSVAALMNKPTPAPTQVAMFFRVMANYSIADVRGALEAHLRDPQRGRFFPMPADLIAQIDGRTETRPSSDEAWAISVKALDEFDSLVWTDEMAQAWSVCKPVMDMGDEVGARMAFKSAYDRLVAKAKETNTPVNWTASLGFDQERRVLAIEQAQRLGRPVTVPEHMRLTNSTPLLLEDNLQVDMPDHVREKLRKLREQLTSPKTEGPSKAELERQHLINRKREIAEQVAAYQGEA